ncbi:MAG: hypothetical protein ACYS4W_00965 [Planctomycetota bacterium]|jgi:Tfp pilus assembly protein PilN
MFTIDLLNGRGIPVKSGPERVAVAVAALAVPVVVGMIMLGSYLSNSIDISIKKKAIANCEMTISQLADAIKLQTSFQQQKNDINRCLSEVSTSIARHTQWSPVLQTLVDNIPASLVLTRLEVKQDSTKVKVPAAEDPGKMVDVSLPVRRMQLSVSGGGAHKCEEDVKNFRDRLRFSKVLGPRLEDIVVAQRPDKLDGRDVVSYQIDCVFRPGL